MNSQEKLEQSELDNDDLREEVRELKKELGTLRSVITELREYQFKILSALEQMRSQIAVLVRKQQ